MSHNTDALIVVDMQNDFLPGGALAVPEGDAIIPVINQLMEQFEIVVATQDWHPADHGSFVSQHPGRNIGDTIILAGLPQILWPEHCIKGSRGADFADMLNSCRFSQVFQKGTDSSVDSYSGFFDNGHRKSTGLDNFLRKVGADRLFITGLATDYCVKFTAIDALDADFTVVIVRDACRAVNLQPIDEADALSELAARGAHLCYSDGVASLRA